MALQQLVNGLVLGGMYALVACGYAMVFSLLGVINLSHGQVYMVGAFASALLVDLAGFSFGWALVAGMAVGAAFAVVVDRVAVAPLRRKGRPRYYGFISTFAIGVLIENIALAVVGPDLRPYPMPFAIKHYELAGFRISNLELIVLGTVALALVGLYWFSQRTWLGRAVRAVSQDPSTASLMGVNVDAVIRVTFMVGGLLAALAGNLTGMYHNLLAVSMGMSVGMKGFIASMLGGRGSLEGAVIGALILGVLETLSSAVFNAGIKDMVAYGVMVLILLVRPGGLLGRGGELV